MLELQEAGEKALAEGFRGFAGEERGEVVDAGVEWLVLSYSGEEVPSLIGSVTYEMTEMGTLLASFLTSTGTVGLSNVVLML